MPPAVIWLTGLPAAGKTTAAHALEAVLQQRGLTVMVLDGDELRSGVNSDLGFTDGDRSEAARRTAEVARLLLRSGQCVIVSMVSPHRDDRARARAVVERDGGRFVEVFVDTPAAICHARDPKGLYARAAAGELTGLTGWDAPYQTPGGDVIRLDGEADPANEAIERLAQALLNGAG